MGMAWAWHVVKPYQTLSTPEKHSMAWHVVKPAHYPAVCQQCCASGADRILCVYTPMFLTACSDVNQAADLQPDVMQECAMDDAQQTCTPAADYLLRRFLGSEGIQAMRTALSGFAANQHQDDRAEAYSKDGELQHQSSLTVRLRARLFGTDLSAVWPSCLFSPCSHQKHLNQPDRFMGLLHKSPLCTIAATGISITLDPTPIQCCSIEEWLLLG